MSTHDHGTDVALLRELHSTPLPIHKRIGQIIEGAATLAEKMKGWSPFAPSSNQIDDAIVQATGLATSMRMLRAELHK